MPPVVAEDRIGARLHQAVALPGIDTLAADLVAGHGDGHTAHPLHLFNLHKAIAEAEQFVAAQTVLAQDALDNHLLEKLR